MKLIWAVVRSDKIELIARQLKGIGVSGCTVYPVRGYGEQWKLYEPLMHGGHHKLETVVEEQQVERVVREITENGCTGREGDGILSVLDIGSVVKICSKEQVKNS